MLTIHATINQRTKREIHNMGERATTSEFGELVRDPVARDAYLNLVHGMLAHGPQCEELEVEAAESALRTAKVVFTDLAVDGLTRPTFSSGPRRFVGLAAIEGFASSFDLNH
jgi:hypothetical protein